MNLMHSYSCCRQGFLHHESIQQWERSLNRLRDRGERLINSPEPSFQDVLASVHWIQTIDSRKRQDLVDKLVKYFETQPGIKQQGGHLVQTFGKTMYFIRKGICKLVFQRFIFLMTKFYYFGVVFSLQTTTTTFACLVSNMNATVQHYWYY